MVADADLVALASRRFSLYHLDRNESRRPAASSLVNDTYWSTSERTVRREQATPWSRSRSRAFEGYDSGHP